MLLKYVPIKSINNYENKGKRNFVLRGVVEKFLKV